MIRIENLAWRAGAFGFSGLNLAVPEGRYAVLMGRTGHGKTTLLELLCGLRSPTAGRIWIGPKEITHLPPGQRGIGYVPQDGALFPTHTVADQLAFALRLRRRPETEIHTRVQELSDALGIAHLLTRKPDGLSGGERQRVALGRALAARPQVLLLDEPLSALDDDTREDLMTLLQNVQRATAVTVLHITHHLAEARRLADLLLRLEDGRIHEVPRDA